EPRRICSSGTSKADTNGTEPRRCRCSNPCLEKYRRTVNEKSIDMVFTGGRRGNRDQPFASFSVSSATFCNNVFFKKALSKTMKRRPPLVFLITSLCFAAQEPRGGRLPNIIFVMVDDMGPGDIGPYG